MAKKKKKKKKNRRNLGYFEIEYKISQSGHVSQYM